jgi:universal stress protein E
MRPIRKILVAVKQPSARALPAVDKAVQLARAFGASIELYHSITERVLADPYADYLNYMADYERETQERYASEIEAVAAALRKRGVTAHATADWDYPAHEAIVRRARRDDIDLIVAECHATKRKSAPWLLHLTDWELLKTSPVPVLLVKNANPWKKKPLILAALDPAHVQAQRAGLDSEILTVASTFSETLGGSLEAMHSFEPIPPTVLMGLGATGTMPSEVAAEYEKNAKKLLQDALARAGKNQVPRHLVAGKPTAAIPEVAAETGCSILVMGAVSRSGLKRVFIGNTAERVLDALPCDVLVVKPPSFRSSVSERSRGIRYVGLPDRLFPH